MAKYEDLGNSRPSHLIDETEKGNEWIAQFMNYAWNDHSKKYSKAYFNNSSRYSEIRNYMLGKQNTSKYKRYPFSAKRDANLDEQEYTIDYGVLPIPKKFRNIALQRIKKNGYKISVDAIDPVALTEKDDLYRDLSSRIVLREQLAAQGVDPNLVPIENEGVQNLEELEVFMQHNYKHQLAIEMEQALSLVFKRNGFDETRDRARADLHDFGLAGIKENITPNGEIEIEYIHPEEIIVGYSTRNDYKDAEYKGRVKHISFADFKAEAGDQFTKEEYEEIENLLGSGQRVGGRSYRENTEQDKSKLKILELEFLTTNHLVTEQRYDKRGNKIVAESKFKKRNKKNHKSTPYQVWYEGKMIVGTDYYYDLRKQRNIKRKNHSKKQAFGCFQFQAIELEDMIPNGIGETIIPIADQIQIAWYKLQMEVLRAKPKGIMLDLNAINAVVNGGMGVKMSFDEILDLWNQSGSGLFLSVDQDGNRLGGAPVQEIANGIGEEGMRYYNLIRDHIQLLRDIYGFNEITDGSTPNARTLTTVANLADQSTINALNHISEAERSLVERIADGVAMDVQRVLKNGDTVEGHYANAIGRNSLEFFKVSKDVSLRDFGIFIEEKPSEDSLTKFREDISLAIQQGQITVADKAEVESLSEQSLKLASAFLRFRVKENEEKIIAQKEREIQLNSETQQQSAIVAQDEARKTLEFENQLLTQRLQMEMDLKLRNQEQEWEARKEIALIDAGSKEARTIAETESREYKSHVDGKAKKEVAQIQKKDSPENKEVKKEG